MDEVSLFFEFEHDTALAELSQSLQERLGGLEIIEAVDVRPAGPMRLTGLEVAAAIGVTVVVVRSGRELVQELRKLMQEVAGLIEDIRALKKVYVDVGAERVPLVELTETHFRRLAGERVRG